ncbi:MAG: folylpolyglutamate synthase/dihydrofolate synthase family protein [Pseudomonadota bacterium]
MNYDQTIKYLDSLQPRAFRLEIGPITEACSIMSNPQGGFPSVHISGTNGKGSTAAFLDSILRESGYRVGLYTSPHLMDLRERIQVNREMIAPEELAGVVSRIRETLPDERMLSYFEMLTLAAFVHFNDREIDMGVIETGLGGRLDATNVLFPKVAVITSVSFDHTRHLGESLKDIATEKCGIIKRGVPTAVAYQPPEVMEVVRRFCDDVGSPLCLATPDEVTVPLGLAGEHQRQNASCAVEAAGLLAQAGFHIGKIEEALAGTRWPGRLETVSEGPRVILDGAHNVAGAESLASYVHNNLKREKSVLLLGVLSDKDVAGIVRPLAPLFREIVCTKAPSERAASPKDLAAAARSSGALVKVEKDIALALSGLMDSLGSDDTLVISGSFTMVGEAKAFFAQRNK